MSHYWEKLSKFNKDTYVISLTYLQFKTMNLVAIFGHTTFCPRCRRIKMYVCYHPSQVIPCMYTYHFFISIRSVISVWLCTNFKNIYQSYIYNSDIYLYRLLRLTVSNTIKEVNYKMLCIPSSVAQERRSRKGTKWARLDSTQPVFLFLVYCFYYY